MGFWQSFCDALNLISSLSGRGDLVKELNQPDPQGTLVAGCSSPIPGTSEPFAYDRRPQADLHAVESGPKDLLEVRLANGLSFWFMVPQGVREFELKWHGTEQQPSFFLIDGSGRCYPERREYILESIKIF